MAGWTPRDIPDQSGKLAIVTGATGGLGLETAAGLAGAGAEVILAGRNPTKGQAAENVIRRRHPGAKARFEMLDLARLTSVAEFSGRLLAAARPVDILINNAGVMMLRDREITVDGLEKQLQTNYLSHFALTARLLPLLTQAQARVVQVSSIAHRSAKIRVGDLNHKEGYEPFPVYAQSKLAMLMFAIEMDRRSRAKGWGLASVSAHPGFARTDLIANGPAVGAGFMGRTGINLVVGLLGQSAAAGATPTLLAATTPDIFGGEYFGPQGWMEFKGKPGRAKIEPQALDPDISAKLWATSERLTGVAFDG